MEREEVTDEEQKSWEEECKLMFMREYLRG